MNELIQTGLDNFITYQNLSSCVVHLNNTIQGVFVGEKSCQNRLQCFKCVLKSKDLQCISIQDILQSSDEEKVITNSLSTQPSQLEDKLIDIQIIDPETACGNDEFEAFWPPINQELKEKIKQIDGKLSSDIMDRINKTFDVITSNFVNTMHQIKKQTLMIAQQVIEDHSQLKKFYGDQKELEIMKEIIERNSEDALQANKELEEFINSKYLISEDVNKELTKRIYQITQKLPQISDEVFQTFDRNLIKLLNSFKTTQQKKALEDIKLEKSTYEKSNLLKIEDNEYGFQSITAQFEGRGQIYSSLILDPDLKYQFVFEFDRAPKECIILGLTEDVYKDLNWYDRSSFYAIQLGKSSNDSFCENILKGRNIKQYFTPNTSIVMQVHINENKLYFADYPNCDNVNALDPKQYCFDSNQQYRIIIYFRNQEGLKLSLKSAHEIPDLLEIN